MQPSGSAIVQMKINNLLIFVKRRGIIAYLYLVLLNYHG